MGFRSLDIILLVGIKRFGPALVARQAPRSAQHSIITSAYRGAQRPLQQNPAEGAGGGPGHRHKKPPGGEPGGLFISSAIGAGASWYCVPPFLPVVSGVIVRFERVEHFGDVGNSKNQLAVGSVRA